MNFSLIKEVWCAYTGMTKRAHTGSVLGIRQYYSSFTYKKCVIMSSIYMITITLGTKSKTNAFWKINCPMYSVCVKTSLSSLLCWCMYNGCVQHCRSWTGWQVCVCTITEFLPPSSSWCHLLILASTITLSRCWSLCEAQSDIVNVANLEHSVCHLALWFGDT